MHVESQISGCRVPHPSLFFGEGWDPQDSLKAGFPPASKVTVSNRLPIVIPSG
jgi:hypothetical protein